MSRQLSELRRHKRALAGVVVFTAVAVVCTLMVAGTLSRSHRGDSIEVSAVFHDATGLRVGDEVRMAGVPVGRVTDTRLGRDADAGRAVVTMRLDADQPLHRDVVFAVDYLNLMGQRYVAVERPGGQGDADDVPLLADGDLVPVEQTRPALDLSALFNAFRPVFDLLAPADVNLLAENIVSVLQGQGPTLRHLLDQTADLTHGLVDRDQALAQVVDNVSLVLETADQHRTEIEQMVRGLGRLSEGLAGDRDRLAASIDGLARLSGTAADLIESVGPAAVRDAELARAFLAYLAGRPEALAAAADAVPRQLAVYLRTLGYGSHLNVYICTNTVRVEGLPLDIDLGAGSNVHTERCR